MVDRIRWDTVSYLPFHTIFSFNFAKILIETTIYTRPNLCKSSVNTRRATQDIQDTQAINKGTENKTGKKKTFLGQNLIMQTKLNICTKIAH